ncbi:hypothetical protein GCM10011583_00570 [Streptomyces camponoticapitis]|uniref:Uncharacterized protein n=1 Tax=Streptomyces camponoticapitis TaxID=1616125 RepID=A0ABQ2DVU8_9ACTN|nr:hypothetical protein GCM10011583_00570 [Streptomyces camponoticapitis]
MPPPHRVSDRHGQDRQGHRHPAEIGQEFRQSGGAASEGVVAQELIGVTERATGDDLPGDEREENGAEGERPEGSDGAGADGAC